MVAIEDIRSSAIVSEKEEEEEVVVIDLAAVTMIPQKRMFTTVET